MTRPAEPQAIWKKMNDLNSNQLKCKEEKITTGCSAGALASIMGRPKADTTMTAVIKSAISLQGFVFPVPSPYLREITVGKGANR